MLNYRDTAEKLKISEYSLRHMVSRYNIPTPIKKSSNGRGIGFDENHIDALIKFTNGRKLEKALIEQWIMENSISNNLMSMTVPAQNTDANNNSKEKNCMVENGSKNIQEDKNPAADSDVTGMCKNSQTPMFAPNNDSDVTNTAVTSFNPAVDSDVLTIDVTPTPSLEVLTVEIKFYFGQIKQNILEIGKRLNQAKKLFGQHGDWQNWLKENFNLSVRTAQRYMAVAKRFGKNEDVFDFQPSQLIAMLALPEGTESDFLAKLDEEDTPAKDMKHKQLNTAVTNFKAELEKAKTDSEKVIADKEEEIARLEKVQSSLKDTLTATRQNIDKLIIEKNTLQGQLSDKNKEIEELRNRPAEKETVIETPSDYEQLKRDNESLKRVNEKQNEQLKQWEEKHRKKTAQEKNFELLDDFGRIFEKVSSELVKNDAPENILSNFVNIGEMIKAAKNYFKKTIDDSAEV